MFQEPYFIGKRRGWVEVVCGCMFSGKTEELLRRVNRSQIAGQKMLLCKPIKDTRYSETKIVTHNNVNMIAEQIEQSIEIYDFIEDVEVVGIDEAQFFDDQLPVVVDKLANMGLRVIVAGLDKDFKGDPFGPMPEIMAKAEFLTKVHAICKHCGNLASYSFRKIQSQEKVMLGESDMYEARCRTCYNMGPMLDFKA